MIRKLLPGATATTAGALAAASARKRSRDIGTMSVLSLFAEGALALKRGRKKRAALLFGAATLSTRYRAATYPIQGLLALDRVRRFLR